MSISDLPVLSALRTKMQWHQERQRVLSENVANSDTPNFKPRDLVEPKFDATGAPRRRDGSAGDDAHQRLHIAPAGGGADSFDQNRKGRLRDPAGRQCRQSRRRNAQVSANQMDYAAVTSLYSKSLHLLKTAIGKG